MKVAKLKKHKENKVEVKEEYSIKNMLLIILIVLVAFILFYLITYFVVRKDNASVSNSKNTQIDTSMITLSNLLNRKENEYYVLAYKSKSVNEQANFKTLYDNYINKYIQSEESIPFYYVDIDDAFNKNFVAEELNISDNLDELKINDEVLFKINGGKIEKTYVGREEILDKLARL